MAQPPSHVAEKTAQGTTGKCADRPARGTGMAWVLAYDDFALTAVMLKPPPWRKHEDNHWTQQRWSDRDDALTADWLPTSGSIGVTVNVASTAADTAAKDNTYHPIKDYLTGLAGRHQADRQLCFVIPRCRGDALSQRRRQCRDRRGGAYPAAGIQADYVQSSKARGTKANQRQSNYSSRHGFPTTWPNSARRTPPCRSVSPGASRSPNLPA